MRQKIGLFVLILTGALALAVGSASADPLNGEYATLVCGGDTYVVVANPVPTPTSSVVSINGVPSTRQAILILDKTTSIPQSLLTLCTAFPPPPDQPFTVYFLLTPPTG